MNNQRTIEELQSFNPSTCISGKMMKCNRIVANIFRKYLKPFNITDSQLSILFVIAKVKDANQKKLGDLLFLEKSTVNRNLNRLMENKLITIDGKKHLLTTNKGKEFLTKIIPHWEIAMNEIRTILGEEGEGSLNTILKLLTK